MSTVEVSDLPALHAFIRGLRKDHAAVVAGLTLPYSDGPSEGANTKVKRNGGRTDAPASRSCVSGSC
jgi:transposase